MADPGRRHPANAPGPWFVDTTCIDCDASAQCAPWMFAHVDDQAVVVRQPATPDEERDAARALLACPSGSIGTTGTFPVLADLYPHHLGDTALGSRVFYCGYNAADSFGANAYFVRRAGGNLLVDSPRWVRPLARKLEEAGGVAHVLLTHRDDVADAQRYAAHFGARVWIHDADRHAAPYATDRFSGRDATTAAAGVLAIPVPGHTRGSMAYLVDDEALFSGDSVYFSRGLGRLSAFSGAVWYSWKEQAASLERLAAHRFAWVLPGHGDRRRADEATMHAQLLELVARMRRERRGEGEW